MAEEIKETKEAPDERRPARRSAAAAPAAPLAAPVPAPRRKTRHAASVPEGVAHVHATFNNTIVTITDQQGLVVAWSSAGSVGFKGSRKGTPYAAQMAAEACARKGSEVGMRALRRSCEGSGRRPRIGGARAAGRRDSA